jgi:putative endopeptidase
MSARLAKLALPFLVAATPALAITATGAIGVTLAYRDLSVKPGDDFDLYANGAWKKATEIPADRSSTGVGYEVFQRAEQRNAGLIRSAGAGNPAPGTPQRMIADYYAAYMDQAGIDARGLTPLRPQLAEIDTVSSKEGLSRLLGSRLRADVDPLNNTNFQTENLFGLFVTQGLDDPNRTVPYLLQGGLGMPDRDYYISDEPAMAKLRAAYRTYVADMLRTAGFSDPEARADRIVALETRIATAHLDRTASEDVHKADNPWRTADLSRLAPGIDWAAFLGAAGLQNQPMIIAWQPGAIKGLSALVASESLQSWKDWLAFHTLNRAANYLPAAYDDLHFGFYGRTMQGTPKQRDRWRRGIGFVNADLGDAVGKIYAARYFPASSKTEVQDMVHNLLAAFDRRIDGLTWMAPSTKAAAKAKVHTLRVGVGYPETWRTYAGLEIRRDDPAGNAWRAQLWEYRHQLAKLGRPVDRGEWWMTPQTVNAVNLPLQNALNFPAAILQPPFFDKDAPDAVNYGAIGSIIGHEVSHTFDSEGSTFDAKGQLRDWWTPSDLEHFQAATAKLAAQYDQYHPFPDLALHGKQTLAENIADLGGIAASYDAYMAALGGKSAAEQDGFSGSQQFFIAFGQAHKSKIREAALRRQIMTDPHSPWEYRTDTVRNIDAWYKDFQVQPGETLYLAPEERVRIW